MITTIIIMTMMIIITTMAVIRDGMAGNTTATSGIPTAAISTVSPVSILLIKNMAWRHNPNYRNGVPYHASRIWQSGFIKPMSTAGMSATQPPAQHATASVRPSASQFQQRTHAAPAIRPIPNVRQRHSGLMKLNTMGADQRLPPTSAVANHDPATKGRRSLALSVSFSLQRQKIPKRTQTNPQIQQRREAARERIQSATPEQRQAFR
ncbi:hypothetical protein ACNKHK_00740 [Shigella flexneri]